MNVQRISNSGVNKVIVTIEDQVQFSGIYKDSQTFDYKLNDKAAKSKLVKGAKRDDFEVEENSTSNNLIFSAGAWQVATLPSVRYWEQIDGDLTCKVGDVTIRIGGVKSGKDSTGENVVNKVVFMADRNKIVCHFYNTTQRILVNGHGYKTFTDIFLKPFFQQKIDASAEEISSVNKLILKKLGPKTAKRSSVRYKGKSSFPCNQCDYAFKSVTTLNNHRISEHALSFDESKRLMEPWHSTKNSSLSSCLMVEDGTVPDNSKEVIGENVPLSNCDDDSGIATGNPKNKDEDSINCD